VTAVYDRHGYADEDKRIMAAVARRLVRQHRLDGSPLIVGEFVAHDSRLRFGSLNHAPGDAINPL